MLMGEGVLISDDDDPTEPLGELKSVAVTQDDRLVLTFILPNGRMRFYSLTFPEFLQTTSGFLKAVSGLRAAHDARPVTTEKRAKLAFVETEPNAGGDILLRLGSETGWSQLFEVPEKVAALLTFKMNKAISEVKGRSRKGRH